MYIYTNRRKNYNIVKNAMHKRKFSITVKENITSPGVFFCVKALILSLPFGLALGIAYLINPARYTFIPIALAVFYAILGSVLLLLSALYILSTPFIKWKYTFDKTSLTYHGITVDYVDVNAIDIYPGNIRGRHTPPEASHLLLSVYRCCRAKELKLTNLGFFPTLWLFAKCRFAKVEFSKFWIYLLADIFGLLCYLVATLLCLFAF